MVEYMEQTQQETYKKKRIYRSAEQIEKCLNDQAQSGLTIRAYCEANGMCENNFYRWTKKYRGRKIKRYKRNRSAQVGFAKIEVLQDVAPNYQPSLFAEVGNLRIYKEVPVEYLKALLS
jgi:hypothetical protein